MAYRLPLGAWRWRRLPHRLHIPRGFASENLSSNRRFEAYNASDKIRLFGRHTVVY